MYSISRFLTLSCVFILDEIVLVAVAIFISILANLDVQQCIGNGKIRCQY